MSQGPDEYRLDGGFWRAVIVMGVISALGERSSAVTVTPATALGIFNYSMMAVVNDLFEAGNALADLVCGSRGC